VNETSKPKPHPCGAVQRRFNIPGAPFHIGARVLVVGPGDETFDPKYLGKTGVVEYYEYDCGCGQTFPEDPMIGVRFANGSKQEFWKEELAS
jgi:hypothetical protein